MTAWPLSALGMQIVPFSTLLLAGVDGVASKCEALLVDIIPGRLLSLALPVADCRGRREAILILYVAEPRAIGSESNAPLNSTYIRAIARAHLSS